MVDMTEIKVLKAVYKKKCHQAIAKHEKLMDLVNFSCHPFLIFCQMADNKIRILINWQLLFLNLNYPKFATNWLQGAIID